MYKPIDSSWLQITNIDSGVFSSISLTENDSCLVQRETKLGKWFAYLLIVAGIALVAVPLPSVILKVALILFFFVGGFGTLLALFILSQNLNKYYFDIKNEHVRIESDNQHFQIEFKKIVGFQIVARMKGETAFQVNLVYRKSPDEIGRISLYAALDERRLHSIVSRYTNFTHLPVLEAS